MYGSGKLRAVEAERLHQRHVLRRRHVQHLLKSTPGETLRPIVSLMSPCLPLSKEKLTEFVPEQINI